MTATGFAETRLNIQKRTINAFVDIAILRALAKQPMTGYGINAFFVQKLGTSVSPSRIYTCVSAMERKDWIKCVRNRNGRTYALTEKGQEIINNLPAIIEQIHKSIVPLLKT